jgi:site-specific DNA-methyltransferase (adenine-specific)
MLDYVFGGRQFRNEIIWAYNTGGTSPNYFQKKNDKVFFYTKTNAYNFNLPQQKSRVNTLPEPHTPSGQRLGVLADENGNYRMVRCRDVWDDVGALFRNNQERLGYPTQKPEKLLERIILASSNEGDLVADFFMGGGTTISVANKLNRKFIGADINMRALQITQERLESLHNTVKKDFTIYAIPNSSKDLRKMVDSNVIGSGKNSKFELEEITIKYYLKNYHVVGNKIKVGDNSIDGQFIFQYNGKQETGLVQVTAGAGIGHLKAFCSEVGKGTGKIGVYISFADRMSPGMLREAKSYGKVGHVDKIQMLTFEQLIDNNTSFEVPRDILTV